MANHLNKTEMLPPKAPSVRVPMCVYNACMCNTGCVCKTFTCRPRPASFHCVISRYGCRSPHHTPHWSIDVRRRLYCLLLFIPNRGVIVVLIKLLWFIHLEFGYESSETLHAFSSRIFLEAKKEWRQERNGGKPK